MEPVAILGAGPAGLFSAWALEHLGIPFKIYEKSGQELFFKKRAGCMYLHDLCGLDDKEIRKAELYTTVLDNTWNSFSYHTKIWGNIPYIRNSVEKFIENGPERSTIWCLEDARQYLLKRYTYDQDKIIWRSNITADWVYTLEQKGLIISTIPYKILNSYSECQSHKLYILHYPFPTNDEVASVVYNTNLNDLWYRMSIMFDYISIEFSQEIKSGWHPKPHISWENIFENYKIITDTTTEDFSRTHPNILLTGRWGKWDRRALVHHSFYDVRNWERIRDYCSVV